MQQNHKVRTCYLRLFIIFSRLELLHLNAARMIWFRSNTYTETETRKCCLWLMTMWCRGPVMGLFPALPSPISKVATRKVWMCAWRRVMSQQVRPLSKIFYSDNFKGYVAAKLCVTGVWCAVGECIFLCMRKCVRLLPCSKQICQW